MNNVSAISGFCEKCNKFRKRHCDGNRNTCMSILFDTIEALQQENEQLRAKLEDWKHETQCHMDEVIARDKEIEQLRAQAARIREACVKGFSYLSLLFHRADIRNWNEIGMCSVKDVKHAMAELENAYTKVEYPKFIKGKL